MTVTLETNDSGGQALREEKKNEPFVHLLFIGGSVTSDSHIENKRFRGVSTEGGEKNEPFVHLLFIGGSVTSDSHIENKRFRG